MVKKMEEMEEKDGQRWTKKIFLKTIVYRNYSDTIVIHTIVALLQDVVTVGMTLSDNMTAQIQLFRIENE